MDSSQSPMCCQVGRSGGREHRRRGGVRSQDLGLVAPTTSPSCTQVPRSKRRGARFPVLQTAPRNSLPETSKHAHSLCLSLLLQREATAMKTLFCFGPDNSPVHRFKTESWMAWMATGYVKFGSVVCPQITAFKGIFSPFIHLSWGPFALHVLRSVYSSMGARWIVSH